MTNNPNLKPKHVNRILILSGPFIGGAWPLWPPWPLLPSTLAGRELWQRCLFRELAQTDSQALRREYWKPCANKLAERICGERIARREVAHLQRELAQTHLQRSTEKLAYLAQTNLCNRTNPGLRRDVQRELSCDVLILSPASALLAMVSFASRRADT